MRVPFTTQQSKPWSLVPVFGITATSGSDAAGFYTKETVVGVRRKKPLGWREPTNYSFTRTHWSKADGSVETYQPGVRRYSYVGCVGGSRWNSLNMFNTAYTWTAFPSSVRNSALIKARLQMQDGEVNYGQAIAESNQTARLVTTSVKRILSAVRAVRRGDAKGFAKAVSKGKPSRKLVKKTQRSMTLHHCAKLRKKESLAEAQRLDKSISGMKNVTGAWLELQYGWKPLMQDVDGAMSDLLGYDKYAWIMTAKGSARETIALEKQCIAAYSTAFASGYCDVKGFQVCKYILIGVPSKTPASLAADLGVSNLPLLGWELTPFSFVVDWFLPVGNFLDSLDATLGYDSLRTVCVEFTKIRWDEKGDMGVSHKTTCTASTFSGHKDYVRHNRTVSSGVPLPSRPSFKDPRSLLHMANSLALLVQVFAPGKSSVR